ncbi:ABC transporter, partial [Streptomyces albidoflavus]
VSGAPDTVLTGDTVERIWHSPRPAGTLVPAERPV